MDYRIISFSNTISAIKVEKLLKDNFDIVIMPVPREISAGCGIAIRINANDIHQIKKVIVENGLAEDLYKIH